MYFHFFIYATQHMYVFNIVISSHTTDKSTESTVDLTLHFYVSFS